MFSRRSATVTTWTSAGGFVVGSLICVAAAWSLGSRGMANTGVISHERIEGLSSVHFVDNKHGWIAGTKGVFWTENEGKSWKSQPIIVAKRFGHTVPWLRDRSGRILWATASRALVTTDDGLVVCDAASGSARRLNSGEIRVTRFEALQFVDFTTGWAVAGRNVYRTSDEGRSWHRMVEAPSDSYVSLAVTGNKVRALGNEGLWSCSTNNGANWTHTRLERRSSYFTRVQFFSETQGWILCTNEIRRTQDGGVTWDTIPLPQLEYSQPFAVDFSDSNRGWIVGVGSIWATLDGGFQWNVQRLNILDHMVDVAGLPDGSAWAVGRRGTVMKTFGKGPRWQTWSLELDLEKLLKKHRQ